MDESVKHPIHYSIFKPNTLISSNETELKGAELKVYDEILNDNHPQTPDKLTYKIPYDLIFQDDSQLVRNSKMLANSMQKRNIWLDRDFVKKYFNQDYGEGFTPFPNIRFKDRHFEVTINETLKRILILTQNGGFTKGDIDTLRGFKHDCSHSFYWLARRAQAFSQVWEIDVDELKEKMFINGYNDWRNFKRHIIDKAKDDMKGTWMEFNYEPIRVGRGGAVKRVKFFFKKGPKDEQDTPAGYGMKWEKDLLKIGVSEITIKKIRQHVKAKSETISKSGKTIFWCSEYIMYSIDGARKEWSKKEKTKEDKVRNLGAWFTAGLLEGQWLDYVDKMTNKVYKEKQGSFFD